MEVEQLLDRIDDLTGKFTANFGDLSREELNWKPAADRWSIGQILEHLILVNRSYFPEITAALRKSKSLPFHARLGFVVRYIEKALLKSVEPSGTKKIKTFKIWEPPAGEIGTDVLDRFVAHHRSLKQVIRNSKRLLGTGTIISSPANPHIVYGLETAYEILLNHEARHFNQMQNLKDQMQGGGEGQIQS